MIQWAWLPEFHEVAIFDFFQLQAAGFSEFVFNFPLTLLVLDTPV